MYYRIDIILNSKNRISHRAYYTNIANAVNNALLTHGDNIQHILITKISYKL